MRSLKSWFVKETPPERRGAERVISPWLVAYEWGSAETKKHAVRDISSTGVYLLTEERWQPGELVSIGLHRKDRPELSHDRAIAVQVRAVRWGKDGVGLSFVQARDLDLGMGDGPLSNEGEHKEPELVKRRLRMARASAFVDRICPSISEDVKVLFRDRLSTVRVGNALEIALKAESLLTSKPDADSKRAHPKLVLRVLEDGSWADEEMIQQLWAGILVSSCSEDGEDESNLELIELFSQLAPDHVKIWAGACERAKVIVPEAGPIFTEPVYFTMDELATITGMQHQYYRIETDIGHLTVFGLLKAKPKSSTYTSSSEAEATPTLLGLEMYARGHGHRGGLEEFYLQVHSRASQTVLKTDARVSRSVADETPHDVAAFDLSQFMNR